MSNLSLSGLYANQSIKSSLGHQTLKKARLNTVHKIGQRWPKPG